MDLQKLLRPRNESSVLIARQLQGFILGVIYYVDKIWTFLITYPPQFTFVMA